MTRRATKDISKRTIFFGIVCIAAAVSLLSCAGSRSVSATATSDGTYVSFDSRDADLTNKQPTRLDGWLFSPPGKGPFPAVVALHGCAGLYAGSGRIAARERDWAERLVGLGYAVLLPDSFTPRGTVETCSNVEQPIRPEIERARDAYGALTYLQGLPFIRADRIGLLGWSQGAMTILNAIAASERARPRDLKHDFRIAVAFYPGCRQLLQRKDWIPLVAPLHLFIGANDDWTSASACVDLVERAKKAGACANIIVYPNAFHDFDAPNLKLQIRSNVATTKSGHATLGTNPEARSDAIERATKFLAEQLMD
jgi:dienelactone hydrolase